MPLPKLPDFFGQLPRFGDHLRDYRTLRGLTVEEVAAAVGVAASALRDMEANKRAAPPKDVILALADALHLGKEERGTLLEAAEMASPMIGAALDAIMGRKPAQQPARPALSAAILVFLIADI